ncbi:MAG: hypothetical protein LUM44_13375 [Pyrinomonadaceae bacterium]|nr:hypothetical protein [Pyrinomonadaceae bacterium]
MKTLTQIEPMQIETASEKSFAIDTTFVLFFLAVEFGQTLGNFAFDTVLLAITLTMMLILPYFLPSEEKPSFGNWVLGRTFIALFAVILGIIFRQTLGTVLPETFRFIPMTLLIVTAMLSCYIQYYGLLKIRLAK